MKKEKLISKYDILLIVGILMIGAIGDGVFGTNHGSLVPKTPSPMALSASTVTITLAGETYGEYSLGENREIEIIQKDASNLVEIKDGLIRMKGANCPDLYCVKHKAIKDKNEIIVCLPHKLVVEINFDQEMETLDGYSR